IGLLLQLHGKHAGTEEGVAGGKVRRVDGNNARLGPVVADRVHISRGAHGDPTGVVEVRTTKAADPGQIADWVQSGDKAIAAARCGQIHHTWPRVKISGSIEVAADID